MGAAICEKRRWNDRFSLARQSTGEWLAFAVPPSRCFRLFCLLLPRTRFQSCGCRLDPNRPEALSEAARTMAGFYLGLGLSAVLLAQPLVYLALGAGWAFTAFGRLISIMPGSRPPLPSTWVAVCWKLMLAGLPLLSAFGFVGEIAPQNGLRQGPATKQAIWVRVASLGNSYARRPRISGQRPLRDMGAAEKYINNVKGLPACEISSGCDCLMTPTERARLRGRHHLTHFRCCRTLCLFAFRSGDRGQCA